MAKKSSIAIVGLDSFLSGRILPWLVTRDQPVIAIGEERPDSLPGDVRFYKIVLTEPTADKMLLDVFREQNVGEVLHCGQLDRPTHRLSDAHEYSVIGMFHVLNAVAAAKIKKLVTISSTSVYGARALNPNYLDESQPLLADRNYNFVADQVEVEGLLQKFRQRHNDTVVTTLRFAPILGPSVSNYITDYLNQATTMSLLGFDPLMQVLHEADAVSALRLAMECSYNGPVNIVPNDVLPLSTMLYRIGKFNLPIPARIAYPLVRASWAVGASPVPAEHLDFLRYLCCGDGVLAAEALGFKPEYSCAETVDAYGSLRRLRRVRLHPGAPA